MHKVLHRPWLTLASFGVVFLLTLALFPLLGVSFFPRTDAGQFLITLKAPPGTRIDLTESEVKRVEDLVWHTVAPSDLEMIVSNIGSVFPDFSAIYSQQFGNCIRQRYR